MRVLVSDRRQEHIGASPHCPRPARMRVPHHARGSHFARDLSEITLGRAAVASGGHSVCRVAVGSATRAVQGSA
jgi:hypothetical protein